MSVIMNIFFSHCRSNIYLITGVCIGLSISLLFAPIEINNCQDVDDPLPYSINNNDLIDEYEPRINLAAKPQKAQKIPKVFIRPRYYSTELGIREKIFVGILTRHEYLHSKAIALNKTIAHLVDKVRYFISVTENLKPNISLPGIVGFTDTRSILQPFHMLKYITDNYLEDYDYFFLVKDTSFVNARKLIELINKISVSVDVHLGTHAAESRYCSLDAGILLSNSIIKMIKSNLDWCVKTTYSSDDNVNLGRCIVHSASLPCSNILQGKSYESHKLNATFDYEKDFTLLIQQKDFEKLITVHPIHNHLFIYKLHSIFAKIKLVNVADKIEELRQEIIRTSIFTPKNQRDITWPIGNQEGNKAPNRFDIIRWVYFNFTHVFLENDFGTVQELESSQKQDIVYIINKTVELVIQDSDKKFKFDKLISSYWKFDSSRGIDFLFDVSFFTDTGEKINKRLQVSKPLGKVEILPVPYVTENTRINMIVIVDSLKKEETLRFLSHYSDMCMNKKDKIHLTLILLYNPGYASKGSDDIYKDIKHRALFLTEKYKKDQLKVTWLSILLPTIYSLIENEPLLRIAFADLYVKKFSSDNLVMFADPRMEIKSEFLNRVRMNTINQWQVYSPIPFVQYHPDLVFYDTKQTKFDILHNHGQYDTQNFDFVSFYAKDYFAVRKSIVSKVPIVKIDKDIGNLLKLSQNTLIGSIFEMFADYSSLNTFRAVEPALKLKYKEINCMGTKNNITLHSCLKHKNLQLGNRGQLTKLILDYKENFQ